MKIALAFAIVSVLGYAHATPTCIVPAKPGGGMFLTCSLVKEALKAQVPRAVKGMDDELRIVFRPGGVGAVMWNVMRSAVKSDPNTLVAFSSGSLLNIAQGKFGQTSVTDVRWVAAIGADYGMIAVRNDSPFRSLRELMQALKRNPAELSIGASGTFGSQDWQKMRTLAKGEGIDPQKLRFVAFEGGGEAFVGLLAGHVQVVSGDASEVAHHARIYPGKFRVLAVFADARLPGALADVPTAKEQGFDFSWPVIRGVYMGKHVSDERYEEWVRRFDQLLAAGVFDRLREAHGMFPFAMTGKRLTEHVVRIVEKYSLTAHALPEGRTEADPGGQLQMFVN